MLLIHLISNLVIVLSDDSGGQEAWGKGERRSEEQKEGKRGQLVPLTLLVLLPQYYTTLSSSIIIIFHCT